MSEDNKTLHYLLRPIQQTTADSLDLCLTSLLVMVVCVDMLTSYHLQ